MKEENKTETDDNKKTTIIVPIYIRRRIKKLAGILDSNYAKIINDALNELEQKIKHK